MKKKQKKVKKKQWPQNLSKKQLVDEYQHAEARFGHFYWIIFDLKKELERRGIDTWEFPY